MEFQRWRRFNFGRPVIRQDLDGELAQHVEHLTEELIDEGWEREAARHEAERRFGDLETYRAACEAIDRKNGRREERRLGLDGLRLDLRYALRRLVQHPLTTGIVLTLLALGIGAGAAIFTLVNGVLLRPLPLPDADRLALVWQKDRHHPELTAVSPPNFFDWRDEAASFEALAAYGVFSVNLNGQSGAPERVLIAPVSADFFTVLGVEPALGRAIAPADFESDGTTGESAEVAVLSHGLWQRRYGGDAAILDQDVELDGELFRVIGVMPPDFAFPERETAVWLPSGLPRERDDTAGSSYRAFRVLSVIGRLATEVELDVAATEMTELAARLETAHPVANKDQEAAVTALKDHVVGTARPALLVLSGAVGLLLLLAAANVANLLLVQAAGREGEMAVRGALGAGSGRLARQLFVEYLLLAGAGSVLALVVARGLVAMILGLSEAVPRAEEVTLDATVILVCLALALLTGLGFGLAPVLHTRKSDLNAVLRSGTREVGRRRVRRTHAALVVAEFALAVPLLIGGGLLARSFHRLEAVDPGFVAEQVWLFDVSLPRTYSEPHEWRAFHDALLARLRDLPGVDSAGRALQAPIAGRDVDRTPITLPGRSLDGENLMARHHLVDPGYFETLRIPLQRGRAFDRRDRAEQPGTAIVNETMARLFWPGEDAIGKRLTHEMQLIPDEPVEREVIGVVADVRHFDLASAAEPQLYLPTAQSAWFRMTFLVRTPLDAPLLADAVRREVAAIDPQIPVGRFLAMPEVVGRSIGQPRLQRLLLTAFAAAAIVLAAIGLYGVMAWSVAQRGHELGLRMALGASRSDLLVLVLGRGLGLTAVGAAVGLTLGLGLSRLLASQLFEIRPFDPGVYLAATVLTIVVGLAATFLPARSTLGIHPARALRSD